MGDHAHVCFIVKIILNLNMFGRIGYEVYTWYYCCFNWYHWILSIGINIDIFVYSYILFLFWYHMFLMTNTYNWYQDVYLNVFNWYQDVYLNNFNWYQDFYVFFSKIGIIGLYVHFQFVSRCYFDIFLIDILIDCHPLFTSFLF